MGAYTRRDVSAPNSVAELRRDLERLALIRRQVREREKAHVERNRRRRRTAAPWCACSPECGIGIETADMLFQELLSRELRDRRAVARFASGAPGCAAASSSSPGVSCRSSRTARTDWLSGRERLLATRGLARVFVAEAH